MDYKRLYETVLKQRDAAEVKIKMLTDLIDNDLLQRCDERSYRLAVEQLKKIESHEG